MPLLETLEESLPGFPKKGSQTIPPWVVSLPMGDIWQDIGGGLAQWKTAQQTWPWQCDQAKYIGQILDHIQLFWILNAFVRSSMQSLHRPCFEERCFVLSWL